MGVTIGTNDDYRGTAGPDPEGVVHLHRKLFITDRDGVEHEIRTMADFQAIVAQMTPAEFEDWKARYRFAPVQNLTGLQGYTGTGRDL